MAKSDVPEPGLSRDPALDVHLPTEEVSPLRAVGRRLVIALAVLVLVTVVVYFDRNGYRDLGNEPVRLSFVDALYYATVTLSTTGYGDITPVTESARLTNILFVTPMRVLFLVVLISTTVEVLASQSRHIYRVGRWRKQMKDHTVVVGLGTKGRSAVNGLVEQGTPPDRIVVIDQDASKAAEANRLGVAFVAGDATRSDVLGRAMTEGAEAVLVTTERDDTAVLVTLAVRRLNKTARLLAAVREQDNAELLTQSGADTVITSAASVGRMLAVSVSSPTAGDILEDLLTPSTGLEIVERDITPAELGRHPDELDDLVLAIVRGDEVQRFDRAGERMERLRRGDRVVVIRNTAVPERVPLDGAGGA